MRISMQLHFFKKKPANRLARNLLEFILFKKFISCSVFYSTFYDMVLKIMMLCSANFKYVFV